MQIPSITTTYKNKDLNFTFTVYAYRRLSSAELSYSLRYWMRQSRIKKLPKNKSIKIRTTLGYNPQDGL
jgi:hypothetical protein